MAEVRNSRRRLSAETRHHVEWRQRGDVAAALTNESAGVVLSWHCRRCCRLYTFGRYGHAVQSRCPMLIAAAGILFHTHIIGDLPCAPQKMREERFARLAGTRNKPEFRAYHATLLNPVALQLDNWIWIIMRCSKPALLVGVSFCIGSPHRNIM